MVLFNHTEIYGCLKKPFMPDQSADQSESFPSQIGVGYISLQGPYARSKRLPSEFPKVLRDQDFLYDSSATARGSELHGATRLRLRLLSEERWLPACPGILLLIHSKEIRWEALPRLIALRSSALDTWIVPKEPQLLNRQLQVPDIARLQTARESDRI